MSHKKAWYRGVASVACVLGIAAGSLGGCSDVADVVEGCDKDFTAEANWGAKLDIDYRVKSFMGAAGALVTISDAMVKDVTALFILVGIIALVLLVWTVATGLKKLFQPNSAMPEVLSFANGLYVFGYLASIVSSMLFFDQATKFKLRILAPVYVALFVLLVYFGVWLWSKRQNIWRGLVAIIFALIVVLAVGKTYASVQALHASGGQGLASFKWYDSKAMDFLAELPADTRIYTNQPGAVYLHADHPALVLPDLVDSVTGLPRDNFEEGVANLQKDVLSGKAVLALFDIGAESPEAQNTYKQIAQGLYLALQTQGDKIYTAP